MQQLLLLLSLDAHNHVAGYSGTLGGVRNNNKSPQIVTLSQVPSKKEEEKT